MSYNDEEDVISNVTKRKIVKWIVIAIVSLIVLLTISPFTIVNSGNLGIVYKWGAIQDNVMQPGFHIIMPLQTKVEEVTVRPIQLDHKVEVGDDGAITKDNQTIGADLIIFYSYKPTDIVRMSRDFGEEKMQSIIIQTLRQTLKETVGFYEISLLPVSQDEIRNKTTEKLRAQWADYPITITELKIVNYNWSDEFDTQIKATVEMAQQVKLAEQIKLKTKQEQEVAINKADADKQSTILQAEGELESAKLRAEARKVEGEGIKSYNQSVQVNLDAEIKFRQLEIDKIKAEKWNGQYVPNNMYGPIPVNTIGGIQ